MQGAGAPGQAPDGSDPNAPGHGNTPNATPEATPPQPQTASSGAGVFGGRNFYRGGNSLAARLGVDVKARPDGLIYPLSKDGKPQGLSINIDPNDAFIQKYGGAFSVIGLPEGLQIMQSGRPGHYISAPASPMTFDNYQMLLNQVELGNQNAIP